MSDLISRQAAIDAINKAFERVFAWDGTSPLGDKVLENLPSAQPERLTDDDFETIRIHLNAYKESLGNQHRWEEAEEYQRIIDRFMAFASAQPELIARDIATIIENEQDMRVVLKNAEHTETHACDYEHTETHDLISRQAAIDALGDKPLAWTDGLYELGLQNQWQSDVDALKDLPPVQPESKREWYMKGYRDAQAVSCTDLCVDCPLFDHEKHECPRFNRVIPRAIEEVKPRWIPVTEALPEKPFGCLVTVMDTDPMTMEEFENLLPYFVGYDGEQWIDWEGEQCPFEVLSWIPLPEPYKEGQDE